MSWCTPMGCSKYKRLPVIGASGEPGDVIANLGKAVYTGNIIATGKPHTMYSLSQKTQKYECH